MSWVKIFTKRKDFADTEAASDGLLSPLLSSEHGCINVDPQHYYTVSACNDHTDWAVDAVGDATSGKANDLDHVFGTVSIEFDKIDGTGITEAYIDQKFSSDGVDLNMFIEEGGGFILWSLRLGSLSNIAYAWIRLGTDVGNYQEWRIDVDSLKTEWNNLRAPLASPADVVGNGWNSASVKYVAVGVEFDAESNALADIRVDRVFINSGLQVMADIATSAGPTDVSPNFNMQKVGNKNITTGAGAVGTGSSATQRVTLASDDPAVADLDKLAGAGLTFTSVPISQATGTPQELLAKTGSQTQRLHALSVTCSVAALVEIKDLDGGVLASWNFGANGGIDMDRGSGPDRTIRASVVNKGLEIVVSAGTVRGEAIVSTGV